MNSMDRLVRRLDHAWDCLEAFKRERDAFMRLNPYRVWQEVEAQSGHNLIYVEQTIDFPSKLAFLTGDCIHNLRATLDNMVTALSGANLQQSAFVILDSPPVDGKGQPVAFNKKAWRIKGIDPAAIALIESLQPYQATKPSYASNTPIGIQLLRLEQFWNRDKHREPSIVASSLGMTELDDPGEGWFITTGDPFEVFGVIRQQRQELWRVIWEGPGDAPPLKLQPHVALNVVFDEDMPTPRLPVAELLTDLHNCVRYDVLPLFSPFL